MDELIDDPGRAMPVEIRSPAGPLHRWRSQNRRPAHRPCQLGTP
jgi:hypothetical protein